ncbi:MAG: hypothetical protein MHM6MM_006597, partial [Cercozoa sp. M6MM]
MPCLIKPHWVQKAQTDGEPDSMVVFDRESRESSISHTPTCACGGNVQLDALNGPGKSESTQRAKTEHTRHPTQGIRCSTPCVSEWCGVTTTYLFSRSGCIPGLSSRVCQRQGCVTKKNPKLMETAQSKEEELQRTRQDPAGAPPISATVADQSS